MPTPDPDETPQSLGNQLPIGVPMDLAQITKLMQDNIRDIDRNRQREAQDESARRRREAQAQRATIDQAEEVRRLRKELQREREERRREREEAKEESNARERRERYYFWWNTGASVLVGVLGVIVAVLGLLLAH